MIYVARHGETEWNVQNRVCGISDIVLTERGEEEARTLANTLLGHPLDKILVSPLKRAVQTGRIISEVCNIPLQVEPALIERNYGIYEGVERTEPAYLAHRKEFSYRPEKGESLLEVACRVYRFLDELRAKDAQKKILLITHGGICRVISSYFCHMTDEEFFRYTPKGGEVVEYPL